jgi:hypothetical protein
VSCAPRSASPRAAPPGASSSSAKATKWQTKTARPKSWRRADCDFKSGRQDTARTFSGRHSGL